MLRYITTVAVCLVTLTACQQTPSEPTGERSVIEPAPSDFAIINAYRPSNGDHLTADGFEKRRQKRAQIFANDLPKAYQGRASAIEALARDLDRLSILGDPKVELDKLAEIEERSDNLLPPNAPLRQMIQSDRVWALVTLDELEPARDAFETGSAMQREWLATQGRQTHETPAERLANAHLIAAEGYLLAGEGEELAGATRTAEAARSLEPVDPLFSFDYANIVRGQATLEYFSGQQVQSVETSERGVALMDASVDPTHPRQIDRYVGGVSTLAALQSITGKPEASFENMEKAARLSVAYLRDQKRTQSTALHNYGWGLMRRGRYREAESVLRRSVDVTAEMLGTDHFEFGKTLGLVGRTQMAQGRYDAALKTLATAVEIVTPEGQAVDVSNLLADAGEAAFLAGDFGRSREYYEKSVAVIDAEGDGIAPETAVSRLYYSHLLSLEGDDDAAIKQARIARDQLKSSLPAEAQEVHLAEIQLAFAQSAEDPDGAHDSMGAERSRIANAIDSQSVSEAGWSTLAQVNARPLSLLIQIAVAANKETEAINLMQLATLSDMAEWDQRRRLDQVRHDPALVDDYERLRKARERREHVETRLNEAISGDSNDEALALQTELAGIRSDIKAQALALTASGAPATRPFERLTPDQIQSALQPGEGILIITADIWPASALITKDEVVLHRWNATDAELNRKALALRDIPRSGETLTPDHPAIKALGEALPRTGKFEELRTLYVTASGAYGRFPLHLLPDPSRPGHWLGERVAVSHLTHIAALSDRGNKQKTSTISAVVAVGDPAFEVTPYDPLKGATSGMAPSRLKRFSDLSQLARLPGAKEEITSLIGSITPAQATVLTGEEATEGRWRQASLEGSDLLVFATHGLLPDQIDSLTEPALALRAATLTDPDDDGLLLASEISSLSLPSKLVILSGCNTAASGRSVQPLSGLPQAFISAGAKTVIVSHWPVRDDVAAFLSTRVVSLLQTDLEASAALHRAMDDLRNSDLPDANNPVVWAPFVVVGR